MMTETNIIFESVNGMSAVPIDDVFLRHRKVFLNDEVSADSCNDLIKKMMYLESQDSTKPVTLFCNSPGGSVTSGLALYDTMRLMKSPITVCVAGMAASMGAILLLAADEDRRLMLPSSRVMIHACSYGNKDISYLKPEQIQQELDDLNRTNERLVKIIAERTGHTYDEINKITQRDAWYDAEEAVAFGLASAVIDTDRFQDLIKKEAM